jgi:hypothetical protein
MRPICGCSRTELWGDDLDESRHCGERYGRARLADKRCILDEFVAVTGYHRKHATRLPAAGIRAADLVLAWNDGSVSAARSGWCAVASTQYEWTGVTW